MNKQKTVLSCRFNTIVAFSVVIVFIASLLSSCSPSKDLTIPQEPTIWIVSEIYEPKRDMFNGMVGYKIIPVNPGSINAKPTWKLDYRGKYTVGQRLDFEPIPKDATGSQK